VREAFESCSNIHLIGAVPQHRTPEILLNLDVGVVCYRGLRWTLAGYPLKMLEYLACGLPVVASNLLAVHEFREAIAIADSTVEWESALSAAINGQGKGNSSSRLAVAKANSWDMRASSLNVLLQEMVSNRKAAEKELAKAELAG